jgi:biopolymer transport protein ExbD
MTPMVDLAFLLLTFFVLTSTFAKPKTLEINYPADKPPEVEDQLVNNALTFIMTKDDGLYYYYGAFIADGMPNPKGKPLTTLTKTDFSSKGLHELLLKYNEKTGNAIKALETQLIKKEIADTTYKRLVNKEKGDAKALTVLVKADDQAVYKNIIDVIDELNICNIGKYAVVDLGGKENELLKATSK